MVLSCVCKLVQEMSSKVEDLSRAAQIGRKYCKDRQVSDRCPVKRPRRYRACHEFAIFHSKVHSLSILWEGLNVGLGVY